MWYVLIVAVVFFNFSKKMQIYKNLPCHWNVIYSMVDVINWYVYLVSYRNMRMLNTLSIINDPQHFYVSYSFTLPFLHLKKIFFFFAFLVTLSVYQIRLQRIWFACSISVSNYSRNDQWWLFIHLDNWSYNWWF